MASAPPTPVTVSVPWKIDTHHVVKLGRDNWEQWKLQITLILRASKVWGYVNGTIVKPAEAAGEAAITAWEEKDYQAQAIMVPTLDAVNTNHVYSLGSSQEIFEKLRQIHSDSSALNKQNTLAAF